MNNRFGIFGLFRISLANFRKNAPSHAVSLAMTTAIIGLLFATNALYYGGRQFIEAIDSENAIVVKKEIRDHSDILNLETVQKIESALKAVPTVRTSYDFFLKFPTSIHLNYADLVQFDTDIFFEAYDFEVLKKGKYTKLHDPEPGKIGIILPTKIIFLLNSTSFESVTRETIGFLKGEIYFGKSSISESKDRVTYPFYVEGLSDDLPVYAVAVDFKTAFPLLDRFKMEKSQTKVMELKISYDTADDLRRVRQVLKTIEDEHGSAFTVQNSGEENAGLKKRYSLAISIVVTAFVALFAWLILYVFSLKAALSLERSKNDIRTLKYLGFGNGGIAAIYFFEHLFAFVGGFLIFFVTAVVFSESLRDFAGNRISPLIGISDFAYQPHFGTLIAECTFVLAVMYVIVWRTVAGK
jgi:hypothetical protein